MMPEEFENRAECFNLKTLNSTCLKSVFERTPFSFRIGMAVRPNLRNKAAFSNSPGEVLTENFVSVLQNKTQSLLDSFMPLSRSGFYRVSVLLKSISIFGLRIPVFSICQICTDHTLITQRKQPLGLWLLCVTVPLMITLFSEVDVRPTKN